MQRYSNFLRFLFCGALVLGGSLAYADNLEVTVRSISYNGTFAPRHVFAIWVNTAQDQFVKSLKVCEQNYGTWLINWKGYSNWDKTDAITSASLLQHETHTLTWNCKNLQQNVIPDGSYKLYVEYTENNWEGKKASYTFTKSGQTQTFTYPDEPYFADVRLKFTPSVPTPPPVQHPYGGAAWLIPGTIQTENYDSGGDGTAYHDLVPGNELGGYRTDDVDIEATTDVDGGYQLGHTGDGEWLEYTVNVSATGVYSMDARVASAETIQFHIYVDGVDVATVDAAATGTDWTTWTTVSKSGISLTAGQHVIRFAFTSLGFCVNWLKFTGSTTARRPVLLQEKFSTTPALSTCYSLNGKQLTTPAGMLATKAISGITITQSTINGKKITQKTTRAK